MSSTPGSIARINIDKQLTACGWAVQSCNEMNLYVACGVAVREFPLETGEADYLLLLVDRKEIELGVLVVRGFQENCARSLYWV